MLNPLLNPTTQAPAKSTTGPLVSANDALQADDFADNLAQNLAPKQDQATAQPPRGQDARPRDKLRGPIRGAPGTAGNEPAKAQPVPLPAPVDGKDGKTERTLPPDPESDSRDQAAAPPTPLGVAALLAELRAAANAPAGSPGAALSASDSAGAGPGRNRRASEARPLSGGAAGHGADANTAIGEAVTSSLLGHSAAARARREGTGADSSPEGSQEGQRDRFAQQLSAASAQDGSALRADGLPTASNPLTTATAFASAFASASASAPAATATEAQLSATPGSAQFGEQLGAQISTFVRDGIEQARLHLNPAEMGPVSVQIHLDGQTAMVHLSAENAHTRQALEQALPLLAGSLREAGLTLSGGGVFEQARQGGGAQTGNDADRNAGNGSARDRGDDDQRTAGSATPARRRGVVDLVA